MKQVLLVIALLLANFYKYLDNEGVILYEQKVNMHRRLPPDDQEARKFIPEFQTSKVQLLFKGMQSLFKNVEEEDEDEGFGDDNGGIHIQIRRPETIIFRDFSEKKSIEQREFMDKKYLIDGEIAQTPWKFTGEKKEILGYSCMGATFTDSTQNRKVVAWFTDAISCPSGPEVYGTLPGMILQLDINDGEVVYNALKIEGKKVDAKEFKAPTSGKKMTSSEYKTMVDEQLKKMGAPGGIKIIRN